MKLYYSRCSELPMQRFVDVLINDNYSALSLLWWLPESFLKSIWNNIFEEYQTLIEGEQANVTFQMVKDITFMKNKIYLIEIAVYALRIKYSERSANILRKLGYDFKYRPDTYIQDCERVLKRMKTIVANLIRKESEFKKINAGGTEVTEQTYIDMLWSISRHSGGVRLSIKDITVAEFCAAYNAYNRDVAAEKARVEASKNKR